MKGLSLLAFMIFWTGAHASKAGLQIKLAKDWIEVPPSALPSKNSYVYAGKKSNANVIHQHVEIERTFPDLGRETRHQCRLQQDLRKAPAKVVDVRGFSYCLLESSKKAYAVTAGQGRKLHLHSFHFSHMKVSEMKGFIQGVGLK